MVSVISTLMLDVSHAIEVLVFMFAGGVRCHTSVVLLNTVIVVACVIFIPGFKTRTPKTGFHFGNTGSRAGGESKPGPSEGGARDQLPLSGRQRGYCHTPEEE